MPDAGPLSHPDLGAVVYLEEAPLALADELPALYGSLFSTLEWFETHDDCTPTQVCVLDDPHHVLFFKTEGDTITVLNKAFDIAPADAERACLALFHAAPAVHRIHLEVMFRPEELHLPHRTLYHTDHMVLELPPSAEDYNAMLGRSTRRTLRHQSNRLRRDQPSLSTESIRPGDESRQLLDKLIEWKTTRYGQRGEKTYWDTNPKLESRFRTLVGRLGEAFVVRIEDRPAAIIFQFPVGRVMCAQECAHDPAYDRYGVGTLAQYFELVSAAERGFAAVNMLWGSQEHKARFGACARRATALSVFRGEVSRLRSLGEAAEVMDRAARRETKRGYIAARGLARRTLDGAAALTRDAERPTDSLRYDDLKARVRFGVDLRSLSPALAQRYGSLFSTPAYIEEYDKPEHVCAVELEDPDHFILFDDRGGTADLLSRRIDIEPESVDRVAAAIFRALPRVQRIHAETMFPPQLLATPHRQLSDSVDHVIHLPASEDDYLHHLGSSTRRNIAKYRNRIAREHPDFVLRTAEKGDISPDLVRRTVEWNAVRLRAKGVVSLYEGRPDKLESLTRLLHAYGFALLAEAGGDIVAADLALEIGTDAWLHTSGFDSRYEDDHLGLVMAYLTAAEAIARDCDRLHMLWGTPYYKQRLGAQPVTGYQLSLFRSTLTRALWIGETRPKDVHRRAYIATRRGAKRAVIWTHHRLRQGAPDDEAFRARHHRV